MYTGTLVITNTLPYSINFDIVVNSTSLHSTNINANIGTSSYTFASPLVLVDSPFQITLTDSNNINLSNFTYAINIPTSQHSLTNNSISVTPSSPTQAITITIQSQSPAPGPK